MPLPALRFLTNHPAAIALRLLLWPTAITVLSDLAARREDDALAAGLEAFAVIVALSFLLALADGLVLRTRPLVIVWSVTTVVLTGLMVAQPLVDFLVHGPEGATWAESVRVMLDDLPSSVPFFLILVGVPVGLGAVAGAALRRSVHPGGGQGSRSTELRVPRP